VLNRIIKKIRRFKYTERRKRIEDMLDLGIKPYSKEYRDVSILVITDSSRELSDILKEIIDNIDSNRYRPPKVIGINNKFMRLSKWITNHGFITHTPVEDFEEIMRYFIKIDEIYENIKKSPDTNDLNKTMLLRPYIQQIDNILTSIENY